MAGRLRRSQHSYRDVNMEVKQLRFGISSTLTTGDVPTKKLATVQFKTYRL